MVHDYFSQMSGFGRLFDEILDDFIGVVEVMDGRVVRLADDVFRNFMHPCLRLVSGNAGFVRHGYGFAYEGFP